ncbi:MAG: hypothetical protein ABIQ02_09150 [Saprospiraceae bacterium]
MSDRLLLRVFLMTALLWSVLYSGVAQRVIVNGNGERLIMYPDGSWRLAEAGDSILLRQNLQKSETLDYPSDKVDPAYYRNPAEEEEYILRQWNELYFKIKEYEKKSQHQFREATNAQFKAGELLQNAQANKQMIESDRLASLQDNYEKSIEQLRIAKQQQKTIENILAQSGKISGKPVKIIKRKLPQMTAQFGNYLSSYDPQHNIQDLSKRPYTNEQNETKSSANLAHNTSNGSSKKESKHKVASANKSADKGAKLKHTETSSSRMPSKISSSRTVSLKIPEDQIPKPYKSQPYECKVLMDTVDAITGTRRITLEPGLLFTNTDPDLRPYFKSKELITCYGRLSKSGPYLYFNIDFQIASSHSQGNFGSLESGSLLRLRLLNGKYVSLNNLKADRGRIDPYSGNTIFTGQYALGKDESKLLISSPLDKIRILWSTGYEDYDVYKIDFFIDQIHCLMAK